MQNEFVLDTNTHGTYGGSRATYLKYELVNVQVTAFDVNASGNDESPPIFETLR